MTLTKIQRHSQEYKVDHINTKLITEIQRHSQKYRHTNIHKHTDTMTHTLVYIQMKYKKHLEKLAKW